LDKGTKVSRHTVMSGQGREQRHGMQYCGQYMNGSLILLKLWKWMGVGGKGGKLGLYVG